MHVSATFLLAVFFAAAAPRPAAATSAEDRVRAQIEATLPEGLAVETVSLPKGFSDARGTEIDLHWGRAPKAGSTFVTVELRRGDTVVRRAHARVKLSEVRDVLVADRALEVGDVIAEGDLRLERRATTRGFDGPELVLVGSTVRRAIAEGELVTEGVVVRPPPIERGTAVIVTYTAGTMKISTRGVLDASAHTGDIAAVRVDATHKVVRGRLVDAKHVLIERDEP